MKQLVTEIWSNRSVRKNGRWVGTEKNGRCKIKLSYPRQHKLFKELKEREEKVFQLTKKKVVVYWIEVANDPPKTKKREIKNEVVKTRWQVQNEEITRLKNLRDERIAKMRKIVESGEEIIFESIFSPEDVENGRKLQSMIGRKKKTLCLS